VSTPLRHLSILVTLVLFGVVVPVVSLPQRAEAASTDIVINEFLAINQATLADNTGAFEDWIELHNTTGSTLDLAGWTISDGAGAFTFVAGTTIGAGEYKLIWASDDVSRTTETELHVPFKLSSSGESLTLVDPTGAASSPGWSAPLAYPAQLEDDSYGIASGGQIRFFTDPTPGAPNGGGAGGLVAPVSFSIDHGFYAGPQSVVLTTTTASATIRYTTNGDTPTAANGISVAPGSSIDVNGTSTIRAIAYRDGWITSPIETRSYLFTSDIIEQGQPAGWPTGPVVGLSGNGQEFDYGMDDNVVTGNEAAVQEALAGIPTISIVTDLDNLVDANSGIYVNADMRGSAWERQASVELIDPTGAGTGFDIEAGIRIRGGFSRRWENPKHALRLFFRDSYESELNYPLFGAEGDDRFEKVDLRTSSNYAWSWRHATDASFIDELWSRDTQRDMGQPYTRSRQYHVYLNGVYWGLYMTQERVSGEYAESYFGGNGDDYDVVKRKAPGLETEATEGTDIAWKSLFPLVSDQNVSNAEYSQIESQVDIVNLADYYLLHFWSGDFDGSPSWFFNAPSRWQSSNNWYAARNRTGLGLGAKWQFFDHDSEHSLCAPGGPLLGAAVDNTTPWNLDPVGYGPEFMSPAFLHAALITHPTYRQVFADRVQLHMLTPGGALTVSEAEARLNVRVAETSPAIEAESARWGDGGGEPAYGRSEWNVGVQRLRDCFTARQPIIETQLRADGLWPLSNAPLMTPASGAVAYGTNVAIDDLGQTGTLYYTTDGSDPRALDGTVSPSAAVYTGPIAITGDLTVKSRVEADGDWTPLSESAYTLSSPPGPVSLVLNEFNAVSSSSYLGGGTAGNVANGSDETFGRVAGNGGDWFELVVTQDGLDIRGWTIEVWNVELGILTKGASLTFTNAPALSDLHAGTLVTVSEDIDDDVSYGPIPGGYHINVRANSALQGAYFTAGSQSNFAINNESTQIAIFDAAGVPVQLRTGEGTVPGVSVSGSEVFKLEGTPTTSVTPDSPQYADGTTSTWGLPNSWAAGTTTQDLSELRVNYGDVNCDNILNVADALIIAQYSVGVRNDIGTCPLVNFSTDIFGTAAEVNGDGTVNVADALLVAQCSVNVPNVLCPAP